MSMTGIGGINFGTTDAQDYLIPPVIPDTASEVLLYIEIIAGSSQSGECIIKIFTEESDDRRFEKYLSLKTWLQDSYTMTEDNMWFPFIISIHGKQTSVRQIEQHIETNSVYIWQYLCNWLLLIQRPLRIGQGHSVYM